MAPTNSKKGRLAPLECMEHILAALAPPKITLGEDKSHTLVIGPLGLGLWPFGPRPWPEIGGFFLPNMMDWMRLDASDH